MTFVPCYFFFLYKNLQLRLYFRFYLKKSLFHPGVDALCTLLIATNDASVWSSEKPQGLHQRTKRLLKEV